MLHQFMIRCFSALMLTDMQSHVQTTLAASLSCASR